MVTAPEAAPPPILRPTNQIRSQGVPFDVAAHGEKMVFGLNRERLEPPLIHVAGTAAVTMGVPTLRVRERKPSNKTRKFPVRVRLDHEVPMIRHQTPGQKVGGVAIDRLLENSLQCLVVGVRLENGHARIATVEDVVHQSAIRCSLWPTHARKTNP